MRAFKKILLISLLLIIVLAFGSNEIPTEVRKIQKESPQSRSLCGPTKADLATTPGYDGTLGPLFNGLDVYHYPITTTSKTAQKYFDQGLVLSFGFNHAEASRSFREAIQQDPDCAMCYWGLGYVLGPNYNAIMDQEVLLPALDAIAKAKLNMHRTSEKEQDLILALAERYPADKQTDPTPYYEAYAKAMRVLMDKYPNDVDIVVLTAEALMDLHPWDLWLKTGEPQPWTKEITTILEGALVSIPDHPQAMHLYIHAMEASKNPEKALFAADGLRDRVPGSGHLLHMPSHLYINSGHYFEGTIANEIAVKVDSAYVEACHVAGIYPLAYYPHNWHFLAACAALEGRGVRALEASRYMANAVVDQDFMRDPELATLQHYYSIPYYIMVKFAMWDEILSEAQPDKDLLYPTIIWRYARAMAFAATSEITKAKNEYVEIEMLAKNEILDELTVWDINSIRDLVAIASLVTQAEIEHRAGNLEKSIELFSLAIEKEDLLNYNEPPDWFFSVRHLLGDVLIKAGRFSKAERVYRTDLKKLKRNGWALMGLHQSLKNQGKVSEATEALNEYHKAWRRADRPLVSSVL